jgi:hypothetical protein
MNPVTPWLHDRPIRNDNPGDLRPRHGEPKWPGQDGIDGGRGGPFAMFITPADGWAALGLWCLDARYLRGMKTAAEMIAVFAPPSENNTEAYAAGVVARLGTGDLDLSDVSVLTALCRAIAHWEESHDVWTDEAITGGMTLCRARWPAYRAARTGAAAPIAEPPAADGADALNQAELNKLNN